MCNRGLLKAAACLLVAAATAMPEEPVDQFYAAVRNNDMASLRTLLKTTNANLRDKRGATPLMDSAPRR